MSIQKGSTIQGANVSRSKNVPYFQSEIGSSLTPAGRQLFETYSRLPASEVEAHIYKIVSGLQMCTSQCTMPFSDLNPSVT